LKRFYEEIIISNRENGKRSSPEQDQTPSKNDIAVESYRDTGVKAQN